MTTKPTVVKPESQNRIRLPYPPEIPNMTSFDHLHAQGSPHHLAQHFGNPDTTIVRGEKYISPEPTGERLGTMAPDLLIAFGVDPEDYDASNGYVIAEQGKPPDFVLEVASAHTSDRDLRPKRAGYAAFGVPEYWRFDHTGGDHYLVPLAGERLVDGAYQSIAIEQIDSGTHQGYSSVLNLHLRWERGKLLWIDPETGLHIPRFEDERANRIQAQAERDAARIRADSAEARVRELEEELQRRQQL